MQFYEINIYQAMMFRLITYDVNVLCLLMMFITSKISYKFAIIPEKNQKYFHKCSNNFAAYYM